MFKVETFVVHPRHGAGRIIEISPIPFPDAKKDFYIIDPLLKEMTIKVPVETAEEVGIRSPMSPQELREHLDYLREPHPNPTKYLRTIKIPPMLNLNNPREILGVIKDLFYEKIQKQQEGLSLSLTKKRMYSLAISLVASEISVCQECGFDDACFTVRKSLVFRPLEDTASPDSP